MRRILLTLLIAISSVLAIQAQGDVTGGATVVRAEYFFDSDPGYGNATIINNVTEGDNALSLSVEDLSPGAHMLYVRSQASSGVWSSTQSHPLLLIRQRPTEAVRVEYFYDTDPGYGNGVSVGNLTDGDNTVVVSVAGLAYGVHHLCLRAQDNTGVWSQVATYSVFVTSPTTANAVRIEYFFDTDPGFGQATPITPSQDETATYALSLDNLSMGAHMLYLRVQDNHGRWSSVQSHPIYVLNNLPDVVAVEYFFDNNDPGEGQATAVPLPSIKTDPFAFEANIAGLAPGEHHLMVRLKKNNGFWTLYDVATFSVEGVAEPVPYAVLSDDNTVLTFYYDEKKTARGGMDVGPFYDYTFRPWYESRKTITTVVFDDSFANCTSLTTTAWWFYGCENLTTITGIANLKTGNVTNMREMFRDCYGLTSLDVAGFNTQNVMDMTYMFSGCAGLTSLDVSHFNTQNVMWMGGMFFGCSGLTSLDLSSFNTQNVTRMEGMFSGCSGLTSLDLSSFNTHNVTDMSAMFHECTGLTSIDVSHFDTQNVTDMGSMFEGCSSLTSLDVSNFTTANVMSMGSMFAGCSSLTSLDLSSLNTSEVTRMDGMIRGCTSLLEVNLSNFNTEKVESTNSMFYGCNSLKTIDLSSFATPKLSNTGYMFFDCTELTTIYASEEWTVEKVTESSLMFFYCNKLVGGMGTVFSNDYTGKQYARIDGGPSNPGYFTDKNATPVIAEAYAVLSDDNTVLTFYYDGQKSARNGLDLGPFSYPDYQSWSGQSRKITNVVFDASFADYAELSNTSYWFRNCANLTTITGIENLNTSNVEDMSSMFDGCAKLTGLDVSHFNTSKVTSFWGTFFGCRSLTSLDLSGFSTENVEYVNYMFDGCAGLTSLDLSSFSTPQLKYMYNMFDGCSNLMTIDMRNFTTARVTSMDDLFAGCTSLVAIHAGGANIPDSLYAGIGNPNLLVYVNDASVAPTSIQNVVVNGVAKEIVLTDEVGIYGNNNFFVPQSFTAEKVTYTRNFTQQTQPNVSRGWESISLPFSVQNIVHESKGDLSPFGSTAEGKKFWLRRLADNGLTRASQIEANVPYVISMPNSTEYTDLYNLSGRVTFSSQYTTVPATTQQVLALADSSIVMMPTTLRVDRSSSVWAINVGEVRGQYLEGSVFERDYREVRPFEAYTVHRSNGPAPRFVPIVEMDSDATGIEDVRCKMSDGRGDQWYDLKGNKLQQKPTQKGVYILNDTKVVIK